MREEGWYWVKLEGEWIPAKYDGSDEWTVPGGHKSYMFTDDDFEIISERIPEPTDL